MTELVNSPCPLCRCNDKNELIAWDKGLRISACTSCGFIYTSTRLSSNDQDKIYSSGYFHGTSEVSMNIDYTSNRPIFENDAVERFNLVRKNFSKDKLKILEIGPAAGFFLCECRKRGCEELGIEISAEMCNFAREKLGVSCMNGKFEDLDIKNSYYDAVALWHVLEHLDDPLRTLVLANSKMIDNGLVFITVPNFDSGNARRLKKEWPHLQPEAHLNHFTEKTLRLILQKSGFTPLEFIRTGSTGSLGNSSALPSGLKKFIAGNLRMLNIIRKPVIFILANLIGRDDFITVIARKQ